MTSTPLTSGVPNGNGSPSGAMSSVVPTRDLPEDLAGLEVDRDEHAPRRRVAGQAERRQRDRARHAEGRAALRPELVPGGGLEAASTCAAGISVTMCTAREVLA